MSAFGASHVSIVWRQVNERVSWNANVDEGLGRWNHGALVEETLGGLRVGAPRRRAGGVEVLMSGLDARCRAGWEVVRRVESTSWWVTSAVVVLLAVVLLAAPTTASAQRRVALVIGNAAYEAPGARLTNPVNDARAMAEVLEELDFDVLLRQDLDREGMDRAADDFIRVLRGGDVALFYYSGHGLELDDGLNYLAPVDFAASYDRVQAGTRSLLADELQARMEASGARTRIVILDACRTNPFERLKTLTRGGLGQMSPRGGLVAYAAEPGAPAADNGLYARQLVAALRVPGLPATEVFMPVSEAVEAASGGGQVPMQQLAGAVGRFVFRPGDPPPLRRRAREVFRDCPTCPELVVVPAGSFLMGADRRDDESGDSERPRNPVTVGQFALGVHEVTRDEDGAFVAATGRTSGNGCNAFDEGEAGWDRVAWEGTAGLRWPIAECCGRTSARRGVMRCDG